LWAATNFQTVSSDSVTLNLEGIEKAQVWVDGQPVEASANSTIQLEAGTHSLLLKLDPRNLPDFLRESSTEVTFVIGD
jgi:hypothetical protein